MTGATLKVASACLLAIGALIFAVPHGSADIPRHRVLCAAAKTAALQAWRDSNAADYRRWQVEVKESCLAAQSALVSSR